MTLTSMVPLLPSTGAATMWTTNGGWYTAIVAVDLSFLIYVNVFLLVQKKPYTTRTSFFLVGHHGYSNQTGETPLVSEIMNPKPNSWLAVLKNQTW